MLKTLRKKRDRRGAVSVEFALLVPVLLGLLWATTSISDLYDSANTLQMAVRQGSRLGSMDRSNLPDTTPTVEKIAIDIQAYLNAAGLDGNGTVVEITDPSTGTVITNLDNLENGSEYYQVEATMPYEILDIFNDSSTTSSSTDPTLPESTDTSGGLLSFPLKYKMIFYNTNARLNN
jgi:Flp pilus assembly protein TadG